MMNLLAVCVALSLLCFSHAASTVTVSDLQQDISKLESFIGQLKSDKRENHGENAVQTSKDEKFLDDLMLLKSIEGTNKAQDATAGTSHHAVTDEELAKLIKAENGKRGAADVKVDADDETMLRDFLAEYRNHNDKKEVDVDILSNKEKCKDNRSKSTCKRYVSEGRCSSNEEAMIEQCANSCGFCCFDVVASRTCESLRDQSKLCEKDPRMPVFCRKSCGLCFRRAPAPPPCTLSKFGCCWDRATAATAKVGTFGDGCPACVNRNSNKFCNEFMSHCSERFESGYDVWRNCPVTCGVCSGDRCDDHPDEKHRCSMYKSMGDCENKRDRMKYYCPVTCGLCGCRDKSTVCKEIPDKNNCLSKYGTTVLAMCQKSCGKC